MLGAFTVMDLSGIFDADAQARVVMGMGSVDEQMVCRAQRALMRRFTHRFSSRGDREHKPSGPGGQPASLSASFSCLCRCSFSECTPPGAGPFETLFSECTLCPLYGKAGARQTTVNEELQADGFDDEDDEPPPLEEEALSGGVADCASAVMRERVEAAAETPMTGRKVTSRSTRYARFSVSHGTSSDESSDEEEFGENLNGPGNICLCMSVPC